MWNKNVQQFYLSEIFVEYFWWTITQKTFLRNVLGVMNKNTPWGVFLFCESSPLRGVTRIAPMRVLKRLFLSKGLIPKAKTLWYEVPYNWQLRLSYTCRLRILHVTSRYTVTCQLVGLVTYCANPANVPGVRISSKEPLGTSTSGQPRPSWSKKEGRPLWGRLRQASAQRNFVDL